MYERNGIHIKTYHCFRLFALYVNDHNTLLLAIDVAMSLVIPIMLPLLSPVSSLY